MTNIQEAIDTEAEVRPPRVRIPLAGWIDMLSYQHGFHAGNFADVHKHVTLCLLLAHLLRKPKPFRFLDSHAGRGLYDLANEQAEKTGEWRGGVGRIMAGSPQSVGVTLYHDGIARCNPSGDLRVYPGSPALALGLARADDRATLLELHPEEHRRLRAAFRDEPRVRIHQADALTALTGLVPPPERRGLVLVDPPYEIKTDYLAVPGLLAKVLARWATGLCMVWYPILSEDRHRSLLRGLEALDDRADGILVSELTIKTPETRMSGSGVVVLNVPYRFQEAIEEAGMEIARLLDARHDIRVVAPSS